MYELVDFLHGSFIEAFNSTFQAKEIFLLISDISYIIIAFLTYWFLIILPLMIIGGVVRGKKSK